MYVRVYIYIYMSKDNEMTSLEKNLKEKNIRVHIYACIYVHNAIRNDFQFGLP